MNVTDLGLLICHFGKRPRSRDICSAMKPEAAPGLQLFHLNHRPRRGSGLPRTKLRLDRLGRERPDLRAIVDLHVGFLPGEDIEMGLGED
jgi:hypothetical protein